ncbi:TPA: ComC/BlpC family leader-containing pheromone/bacteriocin [Streptococcus suis]|uniref:ComC/BlpC family leader-containing pheromone/bacteriocin n=1 Tax=Streptococcus suis TaxID=1307 RepID=UPI001D5B8DAC|nr:ComC/BlpC family leader-containing pheromone/bacteriocin [Streptococcus suis]MBS8100700.1 ComC/BlpC family leader-containing pheromone/bacteriocin [Streptococcus suis]NRG97738.1 ComC/BlpC family leader-containing pheromone/bacteriocin [Streptococcus suis]HEM6190638.1 ComC/BlpC family leader-containing pheromone/bacteriocin [Streptococcus suis]HEM6281235.1 ComC/BlpC family leader-containing pheromone/bacteriocin [Streptococcus suis]HEM6290481.1 ComC/BlpC family leader-containing pheromone/ba
MTKQTKSLTHFSELSSSELHRISGGDWWSDLIRFFPRHDKITGDNNIHKLG